jgi:hypothetical protein
MQRTFVFGKYKNCANILVVSVGFVKSIGAVFHPKWIWEQQELPR